MFYKQKCTEHINCLKGANEATHSQRASHDMMAYDNQAYEQNKETD